MTFSILILIFFSKVLSILPKQIMYLFSDILYFILYYIIRYRKNIVFKNLKNSFPEKSNKEQMLIAKKYYKHLADLFTENFALLSMSKNKSLSFITFNNLNLLESYYKKNKNLIVITGHYNNWEFLTITPLFTDYKIISVYKTLSNKAFDELTYKMRSRHGALPVPMKKSIKTVIDYKNKNIPFILFLVADQRPLKKDIRYWTKFLNQDTPIFLGAEKIAKKLNTAVLYVQVNKISRGKYESNYIELCNNPASTEQYEITEKHTRILESIIRNKPEYWLWSHNRWKYTKE